MREITLILLIVSAISQAKDNGLPHWYNPKRDALTDLSTATDIANGRKILAIVGGDWCSWCHTMEKYFKNNPDFYQQLNETFVVLKINYSEDNYNQAFFEKYPPVKGYPHFMILDSNKKYLGMQNTGDLESGKGYSDKAMMAFINKSK